MFQKLRTNQEQLSLIFILKLRTIEPQQNFPGSYKKKRVVTAAPRP